MYGMYETKGERVNGARNQKIPERKIWKQFRKINEQTAQIHTDYRRNGSVCELCGIGQCKRYSIG